MVFAYLLLLLLPVIAVVYIVWDHRRKRAEREAASAERLQEMLGVVAQPPRSQPAEVSAPASAVPETPAPAPATFTRRERLLTPPQTLLYFLLRTGLPDHLVFAQVPLGSVLEAAPGAAGTARDQQMRRLAEHIVDFVVSDRTMRPVAVIALNSGGQGAQQNVLASPRTWLVAAGLRYLELDATALPRKDAMRALVLGEAAAATSANAAAPTGTRLDA